MNSRRAGQSGFSLVEMMIALLLGTFLMAGLVQVFAASRSAYATSEGMARIQESGRFALDTLQYDIRMAGHFGCVGDQSRLAGDTATSTDFGLFTLAYAQALTAAGYNNEAWPLRFHISLQGYNANGTGAGGSVTLPANPAVSNNRAAWTPQLPLTLAARAVAGSDVIVLRYLRPETVPLEGMTAASAPQLTFDGDRWDVLRAGMDNPGLFGLTDCNQAVVFQGSRSASPGNRIIASVSAGDLGFRGTFEAGRATLHRAETMAYYVGIGASGEPALFRCRANAAIAPHTDATNTATDCGNGAEELVEGVENLQFVYGESRVSNNRPTGYIQTVRTADGFGGDPSASAAAREVWRRIGAVQIGMVVRSPQQVAGGDSRTAPFSVLGVNVTPPDDRRTRTSYESTVALRNRLFGN